MSEFLGTTTNKETLSEFDKRLAIGAAILLVIGSIAGGMSGWAGASDGLPFLTWGVTLPALAMWFGRRLSAAKLAIGLPAALGAAFALPAALIDPSDNPLLLIAISIGMPAIIAMIAFSTRPSSTPQAQADASSTNASNLRIASFVGIILFPQFVQPVVYDMASKLQAKGTAIGAADLEAAKTAKLISTIILGLVALISSFSIIIAMLDAF